MRTRRRRVVLEMGAQANGIFCERGHHALNLVSHGHQRRKTHELAWKGLPQADKTMCGVPGLSQHLHDCVGTPDKRSASMCYKQSARDTHTHLERRTLHLHQPSVSSVHDHRPPGGHETPHCKRTLKVTARRRHSTRPGSVNINMGICSPSQTSVVLTDHSSFTPIPGPYDG